MICIYIYQNYILKFWKVSKDCFAASYSQVYTFVTVTDLKVLGNLNAGYPRKAHIIF